MAYSILVSAQGPLVLGSGLENFHVLTKTGGNREGKRFFLSFIELCLGKEKGFGIQARKNKLQKVLVVNLTPATLTETETQFIRTIAKNQMFH